MPFPFLALLKLAGMIFVGTVAAGVTAVIIDEIITRAKIREEAKKVKEREEWERYRREMDALMMGGGFRLIVEKMNRTKNKITLAVLNNRDIKLEITGTGIENDIMEGEVIYV